MLALQPLRKSFDLSGRARRAEFWLFHALVVAIAVALAILDIAAVNLASSARTADIANIVCSALFVMLVLATAPAYVSAFVRRAHDLDRSWRWALAVLIPGVGVFVGLYFLIKEGVPGPNRFGPDPKDRATAG